MSALRSVKLIVAGAVSLLSLSLMHHSSISDDQDRGKWVYSPTHARPFWEGDLVEGESVLFIKETDDKPAKAALLFPVQDVVKVTTSAGDIVYEEGRDYVWKKDSREIELPAGSRIVSYTPADLRRPANSQKYKLTHRDGNGEIFFGGQLEYHDMQICITYKHAPDLWKAYVPKFNDEVLPRTIEKLRHKQPVSIVLVGDSISAGYNASGDMGGPPYQPSYSGLLQLHLSAFYQTNVDMLNLAVNGKDTAWALTVVDEITRANPDLVIVAFGMNDSAGRSTKDYQANTKSLIENVRKSSPETEFILVASMLGNRDWITLHHELFPEYRDALAELCKPGIALADMTAIWTEFLKRKKDWDLTGNGVNHPNDFGHRVYAQVIGTLLVDPEFNARNDR